MLRTILTSSVQREYAPPPLELLSAHGALHSLQDHTQTASTHMQRGALTDINNNKNMNHEHPHHKQAIIVAPKKKSKTKNTQTKTNLLFEINKG